jgi:hemerythrin-like metal-binding protein
MVWNDRLSVGIEVIDNDHKRLVGIANQLYDAIGARRNKQILGGLLDELSEYTAGHFAREEEIFRSTGYADAVEHTAQHREYLEQVASLIERHKNGSKGVTLELMNGLKNSLFDHVLGSDAKYIPHLRAQGYR